jgi:FKBP-type peptidyl-prolyl cis-trans isomerase FkpA
MRMFLLAIAFGLVLVSCGSDESETFESQAEVDTRNDQEIIDYLNANNITGTVVTPTGTHVKVDVEGSEEKPTLNDNVTVTYQGYLLNGDVFDGTTTPITFPLTNVIFGWQEGIPFFGRGGSGSIYIPSRRAYGRRGIGSIPPDAVIIFDVEIVDF